MSVKQLMKDCVLAVLFVAVVLACVLWAVLADPAESYYVHRHEFPAVFGDYLIFEDGSAWRIQSPEAMDDFMHGLIDEPPGGGLAA